ncbi:MAG: hypothetical protein M3418_11190, partial [Gemmatimonadota bacterium]|nr:hypothetical protein [Gemmatimonadota bacterium]
MGDGVAPPPAAEAKLSQAESHRQGAAIHIQDLDLGAIPTIQLPRAPMAWEAEKVPPPPVPANPFEVEDSDSWQVESITPIPKEERPDMAFRKLYPMEEALLYLDDLGKAEDFPSARTAALVYDTHGREVARAGFDADFYRIGVNPRGRGFIGMSRECEIHLYDAKLQQVLHTGLNSFPEMEGIRRRFEIEDQELRNKVRNVAIAPEMDRYLISVGDEAWCIGLDGRG